MLGTIGCMNNADFEKKKENENIVQDVLNHLYQAKKWNRITEIRKELT